MKYIGNWCTKYNYTAEEIDNPLGWLEISVVHTAVALNCLITRKKIAAQIKP